MPSFRYLIQMNVILGHMFVDLVLESMKFYCILQFIYITNYCVYSSLDEAELLHQAKCFSERFSKQADAAAAAKELG